MIIANDGIIINYDDSLAFDEIKSVSIKEYIASVTDIYGRNYSIDVDDAIKLIEHFRKQKGMICLF